MEAANKEDITGYNKHVHNSIDHYDDVNEKDKVKPKSMTSSTAYHSCLQSVNDNDHVSIKSDDVTRVQLGSFIKENGEHYSKPKSLPMPRHTNDVVATPVTDAESANKKMSADKHATPNDSLEASCAVYNEECITQNITHTTESNEYGSVDPAHDSDHPEIVCQLPVPPAGYAIPRDIPATS